MASAKEASFIMRLVDMVTGPCKAITKTVGEGTKKLKEMAGTSGGMGAKLGGIFTSLRDKSGKFGKEVRAAADEVPGLNRVIELVTNPYLAIAAAVVALTVALAGATLKAMDFEKGMAQVNTTAQLTKPEVGQLTDKLLDMGANSTVALKDIPGAFNSVISAVGDTKKSLDIFEPSLKAAQAGFTDIKTVTEAATNVMGSVGKATPTEVFDALFATMRLGKAEFKDIAQYLPKIIPAANNVGIKYQEIAAAFALMTGKGQSAEQTTMLLQNAMTALGKSEVIYGTKSQAGFIRSGIAIFDHAGKMRSLVSIVNDLSARTQGMTDKQRQAFLNGLGLDAQAASSFSVLAQNAKQLQEFTGGVVNSAGEMETALANSGNRTDRLTILSNKWQRIVTKIGYALLPVVDEGIKLASAAMELLTEHSGGFGQLLKLAAYVVAPVLIAAFVAIKAVLATIYVAWRLINAGIQMHFTLIKAAFTFLGDAIDWVYRKLGGDGSLIEKVFGGGGAVWNTIKLLFGNFVKLVGASLDMLDAVSEGNFAKAKQRWYDFKAEVNGGTPGQYVKAPAQGMDWGALIGVGNFGKQGGESGGTKKAPLTSALSKQNKSTDVEGDKSKARIVNTRIEKIEVIVKVANAAGRGLDEIGKHVANVLTGAVRDSEIILSTGD